MTTEHQVRTLVIALQSEYGFTSYQSTMFAYIPTKEN